MKIKFVGSIGKPRKGMAGQEHLSRAHKQPQRVFDPTGISPAISSQETQGRYHIALDSPKSTNQPSPLPNTAIQNTKTMETQPPLFQQTCPASTFSARDFLARLSPLLESEKDLPTLEALYFLKSQGFWLTGDPHIFYSKTLKAWIVTKPEKLSVESLGFSPNSVTSWKNLFLIQKTSAFPRTASASSLSDILQSDVPEKYFLSETATKRLFRRNQSEIYLEQSQQKIKVDNVTLTEAQL